MERGMNIRVGDVVKVKGTGEMLTIECCYPGWDGDDEPYYGMLLDGMRVGTEAFSARKLEIVQRAEGGKNGKNAHGTVG
jgi:hypothetical protein